MDDTYMGMGYGALATTKPTWTDESYAKTGRQYIVKGMIKSGHIGVEDIKIVSVGQKHGNGKDTWWTLDLTVPYNGKFVCLGFQDFPTFD